MNSENFNYNKSGNYQAYYKAQAPPGGKSSICFGGPEPEKPKQKEQPVAPVEEAQKENSQPGSARSVGSGKSDENVTKPAEPVTNTKLDPIKPKSNDIFGKPNYPNAEANKQGTQPQNNKKPSTRVINPPGGKSSGPLW